MKARTILRPYPVAFLVLLAVLAAVWVANRPARAQTTLVDVVFVDNFAVTPNSLGYVTLDFSNVTDLVELWATCGGAYPQSGTSQIASQVLTRKPNPRVLTIRMLNPTGHPVTAPVRINCALDFGFPATATSPTALRERVAKAAQQASSR